MQFLDAHLESESDAVREAYVLDELRVRSVPVRVGRRRLLEVLLLLVLLLLLLPRARRGWDGAVRRKDGMLL